MFLAGISTKAIRNKEKKCMTRECTYYVYILANKVNTVLYVGVTNNLFRRVVEHKLQLHEGFTKRYNVDKLVYFESFQYVKDAINRETEIKRWKRGWKNRLIFKENKEMRDLIYDYLSDQEMEDMKQYIYEKEQNNENEIKI
jgi:putative endonuclease